MAKRTLSIGSGRTNIHATTRLLPTLSVQDFSSQIKNINPVFSLLPIEQRANSSIMDKKRNDKLVIPFIKLTYVSTAP
jgi:hypothetical protein